MPKVIESLSSKGGRPGVYPWDEYLDGTPRQYDKGDDFKCAPASFAAQARRVAADRGLGVSVRTLSETSLELQAVPLEAAEAEAPDAPTA